MEDRVFLPDHARQDSVLQAHGHTAESYAELIETYLESDRPLVLAIQLLDIRRGAPTELDWQMIDWLRRREVPTGEGPRTSDAAGTGHVRTVVGRERR